MEKAINSFMQCQTKAEESFVRWEECWQKENQITGEHEFRIGVGGIPVLVPIYGFDHDPVSRYLKICNTGIL